MESTGLLGIPREWFFLRKWSGRKKHSPNHWEQSLLKIIRQGTTSNGVFSVKIMANYFPEIEEKLKKIPHLSHLPTHLMLDQVFQNPLYVRIYRRNKLKQAISRLVARETKVYHANKNQKYNIDWSGVQIKNIDIEKSIAEIKEEEHLWDTFYYKLEKQPLEYFYEDFADDPGFFVNSIATEMELSDTIIELRPRELKKLYNEFNESLYRNFLTWKEGSKFESPKTDEEL